MSDLFYIVAVNIKTGDWRVMDHRTDERSAEAYVEMAVRRRGVDEEFFKVIRGAHPPSQSDGPCAEHDWETVGIPQGVYQCRRCGEIG